MTTGTGVHYNRGVHAARIDWRISDSTLFAELLQPLGTGLENSPN